MKKHFKATLYTYSAVYLISVFARWEVFNPIEWIYDIGE